ncbi:MAG TPA: hypothetical protein VGK92_05780 [Gaiellales bacterium]
MEARDRLTAVRTRLAVGPGAERALAPPAPPAVTIGAAVVLAAALALSAAIAVFAVVVRVSGHGETLEAVWWLAGFGVVAPLTVGGAGRLLRGAATPQGACLLHARALCALATLAVSLAAARVAGGLPLSLLVVLAVPAAHVLLRQARLPAIAARLPAGRAEWIVLSASALALGTCLPASSHDPVILAGVVLLLAFARLAAAPLRRLRPGSRTRVALALLAPLLLALLAWDVSFHALRNHQDFFLGPVNDVRHGRFMLVDDYSQYGVGVIYFLAAVLAPLPFGYGSFVLVLGLLSALLFLTVFAVLRIATRSLAFAAAGTFAAMLASTLATVGRTTQYPSTGFLRFGVPWLLVCALVVAHRRERPARGPLVVAYALVGVSAVWSFETAFYTVATFAVTVVAVAWTGPPGWRLRAALAQLGAAAAAVAIAVAGLAAATELGRGAAPRPSGYLDFLRLYSVKGFGTLPVPGWSLGFLMGALCLLSLSAVGVVLRCARGSALARPSAVVPLVAVSTLAATSLTYFLGRSHPNNLTHVAPAFVVMVVLWSALAWREWQAARQPLARVALVLCALGAAFLTVQESGQIATKTPDSALAALARSATGGRTLPHELRALTREPVAGMQARAVELLVRRSVPRSAPLLIAVEPVDATEALIRLDRSDALPIGAAEQDGLVPKRRALLARAARDVPCGTYVVTQVRPIRLAFGRELFGGILRTLRQRGSLAPVAAAPGYRVARLSCRS